MEKEIEVAAVNSASLALKINKKAPHLELEDIIKKVLPFVSADELSQDAKIAAIAAVNGVVKLRRSNKILSDREIIERVLKELKASLNV
jgi:hypothetical protein